MKLHLNIRLIICLFFTIGTTSIYSHGNLSVKIQEKTEEIKENPRNAILYFERGYLYQQHEEFKKAIIDYLKSEKLGYTNKLILFRKAETYYKQSNYFLAIKASNLYLKKDSLDVKIHKIQAQILVGLNQFPNALNQYEKFLNNAIDSRPRDFIEYSEIYLKIDSNNYNKAITAIDYGLEKTGKNTFSLQLKKLEYLETSKQVNEAINQFNCIILTQQRKEFWYYRKAMYLYKNNKINDCKIALQLAKVSITMLSEKFQNTTSIKQLNKQIINLEKTVHES